MAYLSQTPLIDPNAIATEMEQKAKTAMMWALVIAVIVAIIMFSGKRH